MTFEQYEDFITARQDDLTDLLVQLHKEEGGDKFVRAFLRRAISNYEAEIQEWLEEDADPDLLARIADAITTPCYLHS